jgi:anti-sigma B factor antagonist
MDDHGLTVEVRHEPDHVLVTVAGEVDIATVPQLQEPLASLAASGRPLIVDLLEVTFIDASGLGVLASVASQARARGGSLHAVCVRHLVRRLFTITGLDRQIPLACAVTEARHRLTTVRDTPVNGHAQHAPRESSTRLGLNVRVAVCACRSRKTHAQPHPPASSP